MSRSLSIVWSVYIWMCRNFWSSACRESNLEAIPCSFFVIPLATFATYLSHGSFPSLEVEGSSGHSLQVGVFLPALEVNDFSRSAEFLEIFLPVPMWSTTSSVRETGFGSIVQSPRSYMKLRILCVEKYSFLGGKLTFFGAYIARF